MVNAPIENKNSSSNTYSDGYGKLLATNPQELLRFYVDHTKTALGRLQDELMTLSQDPLIQLVITKRQTDELAFDLCSLCPGTDQLENPDLEIVFRHCSFVSLWLNFAYISASGNSYNTVLKQKNTEEDVLIDFLNRFQATITAELARLQLDIVEYSALKAICMWKLEPMNSTETAKILSGEQYFGIAKALNEYHQTKNLQDFEMAARLADICSLLGPFFAVYQDSLKLYETLNIKDCFEE